MEMRHCTICSAERRFEQPPCADEHDQNCPELLCIDCGAALLLDTPEPVAAGAA